MRKWKNAKSYEETFLLFEEFKREYLRKYSMEDQKYIIENFNKKIGSFWMLLELFQVYTELGMIPDDVNMYQGHFENIKKIFGVDKNILDVASGKLPVFADKIAKEQLKIGKGTIVIYDPALVMDKPKYTNSKLFKQFFSKDIDLANCELITGLMPCDATKEIIDAACTYNKDFYVALCLCSHPGFESEYISDTNFIPSYQKYIDYARKMVSEYGLGTLEEIKLDERYNVHTPIIYNKR